MASIIVTPPLVIAAAAIFPPLCASLVVLRFYSRSIAKLSYGADDWLTIPALILLTGISAAILRGIAEHSIAYRTPASSVEEQINGTSAAQSSVRKVFFAVEVMQSVALGCIKLSCMFFYRRIFRAGTKLRVMIYAFIALIVAWTITFFFTLLLTCGPHFDYAWTSIANELKCNNIEAIQDSFAVTDVFTDLIVLVFPLPLVWRMQMSKGRKVAVSLVFLLGTLAIIASLTRMVIYIQVVLVEDSAMPPDEDLLSSAGTYFMVIEVGLGLVAACLPCLWGLVATNGLQSILRSVASVLSLSERSPNHRSRESAQNASTRNPDGRHAEGNQTTMAKESAEMTNDIHLHELTPKHVDCSQLTQTFDATVENDGNIV